MPFKSTIKNKDGDNNADAYGDQDDTDYDQDEIYAHGLLEGPGTSSSTGHISLQREGPPFCKSLPSRFFQIALYSVFFPGAECFLFTLSLCQYFVGRSLSW